MYVCSIFVQNKIWEVLCLGNWQIFGGKSLHILPIIISVAQNCASKAITRVVRKEYRLLCHPLIANFVVFVTVTANFLPNSEVAKDSNHRRRAHKLKDWMKKIFGSHALLFDIIASRQIEAMMRNYITIHHCSRHMYSWYTQRDRRLGSLVGTFHRTSVRKWYKWEKKGDCNTFRQKSLYFFSLVLSTT